MNILARIASTLVAASIATLSLSALAEDKAPEAKPPVAKKSAVSFPMKADRFRKINDVKLSKMKQHLEQALSKRSITAEQKGEIEKSVDGAMKQMHVAIDKVGADGLVTSQEAKQVRQLGEQLREKLRGELKGDHKSKQAKAKQSGAKPKRPAAKPAAIPASKKAKS